MKCPTLMHASLLLINTHSPSLSRSLTFPSPSPHLFCFKDAFRSHHRHIPCFGRSPLIRHRREISVCRSNNVRLIISRSTLSFHNYNTKTLLPILPYHRSWHPKVWSLSAQLIFGSRLNMSRSPPMLPKPSSPIGQRHFVVNLSVCSRRQPPKNAARSWSWHEEMELGYIQSGSDTRLPI